MTDWIDFFTKLGFPVATAALLMFAGWRILTKLIERHLELISRLEDHQDKEDEATVAIAARLKDIDKCLSRMQGQIDRLTNASKDSK